MLQIENEVSDIYLNPGESYLARKPAIIRTILGSCVGVAFWSARLGVGGLTHSQLPRCPANPSTPLSAVLGRRYVDFSIRDLARQLDELGAVRAELQVKVFGGADVLLVDEAGSAKPTVGKLNCDAALETLLAEGLRVCASSLGGKSGLNLRFDTRTGEVLVRRLG
ncbi:MAG: chemotaxis protein CheD [Terriglobales bacterium]